METEKQKVEKQLNNLELQRKQLCAEKDVLADARDSARALALNMEKDKQYAEALLKEARNANADLEAHAADVEQNLLTLQGKCEMRKNTLHLMKTIPKTIDKCLLI